MKKIIALMMALVMVLAFTACGGGKTPAPAQNSSGEESAAASQSNSGEESSAPAQSNSGEEANAGEAEGTEFVDMNFGDITMSVPSTFGTPEEKDGTYVSSGPNYASIIVMAPMAADIPASEWDESLAEEIVNESYGSTYTDIRFAAFEGNINMNGSPAVYYGFYGKNASGIDRLIQVVRLYTPEESAMYMIALAHDADDEFFTPEISGEIINSIMLGQ